jgi:hypothetical protein
VWNLNKILQNRNGFKNHFQTFANQVQCHCYFVFPKKTKPTQSDHMALCQDLWLLHTAKVQKRFEFKKSLNSFENQSRKSKQKKKKNRELEKGRRQELSPATDATHLAHPAPLSLSLARADAPTQSLTLGPHSLSAYFADKRALSTSLLLPQIAPADHVAAAVDAGNGAA